MSSERFAEIMKDQKAQVEPTKSMGAKEAAMEGLKEAGKAFGQGLADLTKATFEVAYSPEVKDAVAHGAHELASALFNGNGGNTFVMYPRGQHGDQGQEKQQEPQKEQERGGRGM
jgi:hypothetical protein